MTLPASVNASIEALPAVLREAAARWYERLCEAHAPPSDTLLPDLSRFVASSEFAAGVLLRDWGALGGHDLAVLRRPPDRDALVRFASAIASSDESPDDIKASLRAERHRQFVRLLWADAIGGASVDTTLKALSGVADEMLRAAAGYAGRQLQARFGLVRDDDGDPVPLVILGMGKLGGGELNFSSDIDLIFTYPRDGASDGGKSLHAQQYFGRLAREIIAMLDEVTQDGFVFRIDTRLRPFGDSGPPVVSFAALENYLLQNGRDWERYAYVKARIVGPEVSTEVRRELFDDLILPFVFRRYLDFGVFESLREMHAMISAQVKRRELKENIKLGPGGIREIEFVVQSLQLVRGGNRPQLRSPSLQTVLPLLVDSKGITLETADDLAGAYRFLRRIENAVQAIRDSQTHDLPDDAADRARLFLAMGHTDWESLFREIQRHRDIVSRHFDEIALRGREEPDNPAMRERLLGLWDATAGADEWQASLATLGFADSGTIADLLVGFQAAEATRKSDSIAARRLRHFVPRLLLLARDCDHPARAVARSLAVVEQVLRRSAYIALLNENRLAAQRLVRLCEQSAYIGEQLAQFPVLLDELLNPERLSGPLCKAELSEALRASLEMQGRHETATDAEQHMERLARFQRATMFRIAVADFGGELPLMKVSDSLTFLAETVLDDALEVAWRDLTSRHGVPRFEAGGKRRTAGFGIIAYGKLGGLELSYGSDLDIVFLHDSHGSAQSTDGDRPLENSMFFLRLVRRLVHFLTTQTSTGAMYEIDTRLRPSGRKGLLVTSADSFERYQEENAWTWEHQALLRARAVAGSPELAAQFARIRGETLSRRVRRESLRDDVLSMRERMRAELDRSGDAGFDLKQGRGGIGDIEFIVQYLVLKNAACEPSVYEYTDNIRQLDALARCAAIPEATAGRLQNAYLGYRQRLHRLVLNGEPPLAAADELLAERGVVTDAWQYVFSS